MGRRTDMKLLDNMKISAKASIPIALVALLMVAMVAVSVGGLNSVSSQASLTINHTDPANVLGARTNRLIMSQAYSIYRNLTLEGGSVGRAAPMGTATLPHVAMGKTDG